MTENTKTAKKEDGFEEFAKTSKEKMLKVLNGWREEEKLKIDGNKNKGTAEKPH